MSTLLTKIIGRPFILFLQTHKGLRQVFPVLMVATLASLSACQQITPKTKQIPPISVSLPNTEMITMRSSGSARDYQIFIAEPAGAEPIGGYPILYMTDANVRFATMVEAARAYERGHRNINSGAIIVGIGYTHGTNIGAARSLDLTPALSKAVETPEGFGGAEQFLDFIQDDLRPEIERRYTIAPDKQAIFGHSFGGLFALYVLSENPDTFQTYLVSSPSIWWGQRHILKVLEPTLRALDERPAALRILTTVGEYEQGSTRPTSNPNAPPGFSTMAQVDDAKALEKRLSETAGIDTGLVVFAEESHGSVPPAAMSRAVTFMFETP